MTVGLVVWTLIGGFAGQSSTVFQRNRAQLLQGSMSLTEIVMVDVITTTLQFMHQIVIIVAVFIIFMKPLTSYSLLSVIGLALVIANGYWLTMVFGIVGSRFRDLSQIMSAIMRIAFLATPIIWVVPEVASGEARGHLLGKFLLFNPFYHLLEVVRAPLLGNHIEWSTWLIVILMTISGFVLMRFMYTRFGRLVPLWV
jgi:ABC-2 type transport system permease protein/lipopolysaccharide transport system permease protein